MDAPTPQLVNCPRCWELNPAIEEHCRACGAPLTVVIGPPAPLPRRFGLASVMLLIAAIAACLGAMRQAPGLGVPMLLVLTPTLVRTTLAVHRRRADGRAPTRMQKLDLFVGSLSVVLLTWVAASIAFFATCFVAFWGGAGLASAFGVKGIDPMGWGAIAGGIVGTLASLIVIYLVARRLWPIRD